MGSYAAWVGQLVQAARTKSTQHLMARMDAMDSAAQSVAFALKLNPAQMEQQAHDKFRNGKIEHSEKWASFAAHHMAALQAFQRSDTLAAHELYKKAAKSFRELFDKVEEDEWLDEPVIVMARTFCRISRRAHSQQKAATGNSEIMKETGEEIRRTRTSAYRHAKARVLLSVTVMLYKLYFKMGSVFLMKDLYDQVMAFEAEFKRCPTGEICAFKFFHGVLMVMDEKWAAAQADLVQAFRLCHPASAKNKAAILSYLVPVRMLQGVMPRADMLERHGLRYFEPIVAALKAGDPAALQAALDAEQLRFMWAGTYLVMEKMHVVGYRQLLKRVLQCQAEVGMSETQVRLHAVQAVFAELGLQLHLDEIECIVANLIAKKLVKGYIAHQQRILVVLKGGVSKAFPPLTAGSI